MCLAVPMQITEISGDTATVNVSGLSQSANVSLIDTPAIGDYVLIHAGFAIQRIDEDEAFKTAELLNKMASFVNGEQ